jgi:hypothetical protein
MSSNVKFAEFDNFASRVYQDEPITFSDAQMESLTPPEYRAMRKIASGRGFHRESDEKIFYKQARFMEDFEDSFDYKGEFAHYFPTYQSMSDHQLRGYFSWRTNIRRGIIEKTSISFVFVYIFELINGIGVCSPDEGFYALKNLWTAYKDIDHRISRYVRLWLKDYVVYNNLDRSLLEDILDTNFDNAILTLINHKAHSADEVFSALSSLTSYNLEKSRFFKQYSADVKNVICAVFSALSDYYDKYGKNSFLEKFIGRFYTGSYLMFSSAVFYNQIRQNDYVYKINDLCTFKCKNGNWSCESFFRYGGRNKQIRTLLKVIDSSMRQKYDFKPSLKTKKITKVLQRIINESIDKYLENQREAVRPKIEIDVSRLQSIREAALEIQGKLLVGEPEQEEADAPDIFDKEAARENDTGLSETERRFMGCLLYGRAYNDPVQSKGQPLSVLIDAINEKIFDRFGDTVIIENEGRPELIADYVEDLKEIIRE